MRNGSGTRNAASQCRYKHRTSEHEASVLGERDVVVTPRFFQHAPLHPSRALQWAELALATPVVVWGGLPFFEAWLQSVLNRSLNMFTLIALGTGPRTSIVLGLS